MMMMMGDDCGASANLLD